MILFRQTTLTPYLPQLILSARLAAFAEKAPVQTGSLQLKPITSLILNTSTAWSYRTGMLLEKVHSTFKPAINCWATVKVKPD